MGAEKTKEKKFFFCCYRTNLKVKAKCTRSGMATDEQIGEYDRNFQRKKRKRRRKEEKKKDKTKEATKKKTNKMSRRARDRSSRNS
jgi:sRNA-binding protein